MANKKVVREKIVITLVTHFSTEDPEFNGDYFDIELQRDGKTIAGFGDYYHDKGQEKADGFIQGIEYALGVKLKIVRKNLADRDF